MKTRTPLIALLVLAVAQLAPVCTGAPRIGISSPGALVETCEASVAIEVAAADFDFDPDTGVTLNFAPVAVTGGPDAWTATLGPDDLSPGENLLLVRATRKSDGEVLSAGQNFDYTPPVSAFQLVDEGDLITGPLAHNKLGDYMLSNCVARFVVQDVAQRDLYSVGQYGGNLIDLERVDAPGIESFLEIAPMVNLETVVNAQTAEIVNDGANGEPAVVRTCGPDDLLDFVNPSTQITDLGIDFPDVLDDNDQAVTVCTEYRLAPGRPWLELETTVFNEDDVTIEVVMGDWLNAAGELDVFMLPNPGLGPALTNRLEVLSTTGFDEAAGVDYGYVPTNPFPGEYVVISGVTVILDAVRVLQGLLGADSGTPIEPGGHASMLRYVSVGDGTGHQAVETEIAIEGLSYGWLSGCVTMGEGPAPRARVSVGTVSDGEFDQLVASFTVGDDGCYAGKIPVPDTPGDPYAVIAGRRGTLYEAGASTPTQQLVTIEAWGSETASFALPATGVLSVTCRDAQDQPVPARVTVVGIDPSPEPLVAGRSLPGFGGSTLGQLHDPQDSLPFGVVATGYCDATGTVAFEVEPGSHQAFVSRGTEYSAFDAPIEIVGGQTTPLVAQIAHVLETPGFVSSDTHVHGIRSADSRVSDRKRVLGYAGNGVDNIIMTDHHVHTDLSPAIAELSLGTFVASTIGEEITSFDYGHWNAYPLLVDPTVPTATPRSGGSTDWAQAAPPGMDFPSFGNFNARPDEVFALATALPAAGGLATPTTAVQINHIDSHFAPLRIDTGVAPTEDDLDAEGRANRRLPPTGNLFFAFDALELWNGSTRGAQGSFLGERIGIWMNLLSQDIPTTFVASTDSHRFTDLSAAGASTWTAAPDGFDEPATLDSLDVGMSVRSGRAVTGQGVFLSVRLLAQDGSESVADLTWDGATEVTDAGGDVELEITVQAPLWAEYDTIEIYANAATVPVDPKAPYLYGATPSQVLTAGVDFTVDTVLVDEAVPGASRLETRELRVAFDDLAEDTWFVVLAKGTDGVSRPMFPVFPRSLSSAGNGTLEDLLDGNLGESGVTALGVSNALWYRAP